MSRLRDFFGLVEERFAVPRASATAMIAPKYGLFDHQRTAVRKLETLLANDGRRAVLHLPTGVGKTLTAMHIVAEWLRIHDPSVVVWLASGKELLEQAVLVFKEAWSHLGTRLVQVGTMWSDRTPDLDRFADGFLAVGLAKGWAALARTDPDWAARLSRRVRLVVFDEAHQSIARTYRGWPMNSRWTSAARCWGSPLRPGERGRTSTRMASLPSSLLGTRSRLMYRRRIPSNISSTTAFLPDLFSARSLPTRGWK